MTDAAFTGPFAPTGDLTERIPTSFEAKTAANTARRGPLRFEEGVATDTDIPNEFVVGLKQGYETDARGHNKNVFEKYPEETIRERTHMGSSSWIMAPTMLGDFAAGAGAEAEQKYVEVDRSGQSYMRQNPAVVRDL